MKKYILLILLFCIVILPSVSATCTLTLDKDSYSNGESPEVIANCDGNPEKNTAYTITWTNGSGDFLESDTGTTPNVAGTNFFETFALPSNYVAVNGTILNVNMTGTNLEGTDTATIQTAQADDIIISSIRITSQVLVNRAVGVHADIKDENGKGLSNALCNLEVFDGNNIPTIVTETTRSLAGEWGVSTRNLNAAFFKEATQFSLVIHCFCGTGANLCIDEDGVDVNNSGGSTSFPFSIGTWLNVNTLVDREVYNMGEEIFMSTNVTNVEFTKRIPLKIFHQARCSAGIDNDDDLDRVLLFSDDAQPDIRGIGVGQTQMQTKRFIIPEAKYLQGRDSQCYASTETWVISEENTPIFGYTTTSPVFNITSDTVQIDPTWVKINGLKFNAVINMSSSAFREYNATVTSGNFDVRLAKVAETIADDRQRSYNELDMQRFLQLEDVKSITVRNQSTLLVEHIDYEIELTKTGHIEIEVKNQDITPNGWINITFELHNFLERQAIALEGINNSAGTFDFSITVPNAIGEYVQVTGTGITGQGQILNRDVQITCQVVGHPDTLKSFTVFTTNSFTFNEQIKVPILAKLYTMKCTAKDAKFGTYVTAPAIANFNKLEHTLSVSKTTSISDKIADVLKDIVNKIFPIINERKGVIFIIGGFLVLVLIVVLLGSRKIISYANTDKNVSIKNY